MMTPCYLDRVENTHPRFDQQKSTADREIIAGWEVEDIDLEGQNMNIYRLKFRTSNFLFEEMIETYSIEKRND